MTSIPIFLNGDKQHILILGVGAPAMAKLALFADSGAAISVIGEGALAAVQTAWHDGYCWRASYP